MHIDASWSVHLVDGHWTADVVTPLGLRRLLHYGILAALPFGTRTKNDHVVTWLLGSVALVQFEVHLPPSRRDGARLQIILENGSELPEKADPTCVHFRTTGPSNGSMTQ